MQNIFDTKFFKVVCKNKSDIREGWKGAGVAVPVFSLKSKCSFGIGDFSDIKLLAEWCSKVGLKMIQILPINDTRTDNSWDNSYPYKAISTKALSCFLSLCSYHPSMNERVYGILAKTSR